MQDTEAPTSPPLVHPRSSRGRRIGAVLRRDLLIAGWIVGAIAAAGVVMLVGFRLARSGSLPNMEVAGADVGGLDAGGVRARVAEVAETLGAREIEFARPGIGAEPALALTFTIADLGYEVDVDATAEAVLHHGRQGNPVHAVGDQIRATFDTIRVHPVETLDQAVFDAWVRRTAAALSTEPVEGDVVFDGARVVATLPSPGGEVVEEDLAFQASAALGSADPGMILVATRVSLPETTEEGVEDARLQAEAVVSGPVELTRGGASVVFTPGDLGRIFHVDRAPVDATDEFVLVPDPAVVQEVAADQIDAVDSDPVDAHFEISGDRILIIPGRKGFAFDPELAADQLLAIATTPTRTAELDGRTLAPEFTVADAEALHIDERVATFTTYHPCCEPRVTNIHRIADILHGTVIAPGETFSVNQAVGMRTEENGFVAAPAIRNGEFVEEVGGGISQFATTMFNAIFFGGYDFVEYKAHSYYFSRYPLGREATVSWTSPDLAFRNDSDSGILVRTSYTSTSITVIFYGHVDVEIDSTTGEPFNFTEPETTCKENPDLAPGEVVETQEGHRGYDVVVHRIFEYPDGSTESEQFFTRYLAEPYIVEQRNCEKQPE
jgi:vancomycin resistance protein YoaR